MSASYTNPVSPFHCTTTDDNVKQIQNSIQLKIVPNPKFTNNSMPFQAICFRKPPPRFSSMETRASPTPSMPKTVGGDAEEVLPPVLDSSSDPPPLFDGTTRLYTSYICPYAQRVWIARNYKGLQEKIKLVPIDLQNRPDWYKEKVYPPNKVPSLEHNNEIRGESLDLLKYIDSYFEGPALYPDDPTKREFAEELLSYTNTFNLAVITSLKGGSENEISTAFDYLESALFKFTDGPFFLGRPMLTSWIEEMNEIEAYKQTKRDLQELIAVLKKRFSIN